MARAGASFGAGLLGGGSLILLTIGTMLPFDRLVRAIDRWAGDHGDREVFAQIGDKGQYRPIHMRWAQLLGPQEFAGLVDRCELLIAHAGTGSFFLAAERMRPIVLFPRRASLGEHNTDHQVSTARWLLQKPGVYVAMAEDELPGAIAKALSHRSDVAARVPPFAPEAFIGRLREALLG